MAGRQSTTLEPEGVRRQAAHLRVELETGRLERFPKLKAAVLESNASWLPLILSRSSNFSDFAFQRRIEKYEPAILSW